MEKAYKCIEETYTKGIYIRKYINMEGAYMQRDLYTEKHTHGGDMCIVQTA